MDSYMYLASRSQDENVRRAARNYGLVQTATFVLLLGIGLHIMLYPIGPIKSLQASIVPFTKLEAVSLSDEDRTEYMWRLRFDHPEPNFRVLPSCAEFWSTLTTIPMAGIQLLLLGLYFNFPIPIIYMYLHTIVMYCGAFTSHMTLVADCFSITVILVIANSLVAFWMWGSEVLPIFNSAKALHFFIFLLGIIADICLVLGLPHILGDFGGFKMLSIAQPPFVLLGWLSAEWIRQFKYPTSAGVDALCTGGRLLISAMALSSIETFIHPLVLSEAWMHFPVLHIAIHIVEQVGIYYYGVGLAWLHMHHNLAQPDVHFVPHSVLFGLPIVITLSDDKVSDNNAELERIEMVGRRGIKSKDASTISDASGELESPLDLLDESVRRDPFPFYASMLNSKGIPKGPQAVVGERNIYAVYDVDMMAAILRDDAHFSSNPYSNERFLGLSTSAGDFHQKMLKLISPYYTSSHLKSAHDHAFASAVQKLTSAMVADANKYSPHRYDVYKWANRMAVVSGLIALGFSEHIYNDLVVVDRLQIGGLNMVKAVAPVGGSGARHGISIKLLATIAYELLRAVPSVLRCCWEIGIVQSWKLFRPFDSVVLDLMSSNAVPRSGILQYPRCVASAATYFRDLNDIWFRDTKAFVNAGTDQSSVLHALLSEERRGGLERYQVLGLIAQLTVGMTVANGLMSSIYHLASDCSAYEMKGIFKTPDKLRSFIHEVLRHDAPLQRLPRRVTAPIELCGTQLLPGDTLILFLGMANMQHGSGVNFDFKRQVSDEQALSDMYTFGKGVHRCLGRALSYMEIEKALQHLGGTILVQSDLQSLEYERLSDYDVGNYGFTQMYLTAIRSDTA